ncbi:unnamed protein product [Adineta ricciae]|uniref:Uncharacterized protein n=1 Tax=Adineta ricciae TaxID=249248 RepID=A0A813P4I2_ADIRI|nr:unnamed protein product [Adineta ricciae]CAF1030841.1 unnamed protein product [Adineta ricciae]
MSDSFMLSMFSLAMFLGSYLSGLFPLGFNLSETKMRYVTVLGAGLLVGTALAVIIPEGVNALYTAEMGGHQESHSDHKIVRRHLNEVKPDKVDNIQSGHQHPHDQPKHLHSESEHKHTDSIHSTIGITLVLGFVFMLIIDNCSSRIIHRHGSQVIDSSGSVIITKPKSTWTATLGAASATSRFNVELIVFMAIILHKAPAAFGLVSFLLSDGVDRKRIRRHLLIFSLAAPVMAIFTFVLLKSGLRDSYSVDSTGIAMLFSAGTFLFVATVHILPEVQSHFDDRQFRAVELLILIVGCCFPIVLSMGHKH